MEERESAEIKNRRAKLAKLRIQWAENQRQINELEELLKFRYNTKDYGFVVKLAS